MFNSHSCKKNLKRRRTGKQNVDDHGSAKYLTKFTEKAAWKPKIINLHIAMNNS